jgi:hypothetical protein
MSMNNLASTLRAQGDLTGARALQESALAVRRRVLGKEHPDSLTSMNNLALTLRAQGDLAGARALEESALAIRYRVLDKEHPDTIVSAWNLFRTLTELGDQAAASDLLQRHLLPLLEADPATLSADLKAIQVHVKELLDSTREPEPSAPSEAPEPPHR